MTGPSERAVEAAGRALNALENEKDAAAVAAGTAGDVRTHTPLSYEQWRDEYDEEGRRALTAAHDPALGEDAYVRLGDVLAAHRRWDVEREEFLRRNLGGGYFPPFPLWLEREHREGRL